MSFKETRLFHISLLEKSNQPTGIKLNIRISLNGIVRNWVRNACNMHLCKYLNGNYSLNTFKGQHLHTES